MAVGAAIGSAVVGVGGLVQGKKQGDAADASFNKASGQLEKYMQMANTQGENALEFSQGMLTDWEDTFGGIEDNLKGYYENLDPAKYSAQYKSNLNDNIDTQLGQMNDTLSASGLQSSGMQAQASKEAAFAKATGGAQADLAAEDKVRGMQQGFLNSGASQKSRANAAVGSSFNNLANLNSNAGTALAGQYNSRGNTQAADAGGFMKGGLGSIAGGLGNFAGSDTGKAFDKKMFG